MILSAVYMLWMFQRVNYGEIGNEKNRSLRDLSVREWFVIAPVCAMAVVMGVLPGVFLKPMEPAVARVVEHIRGAQAVDVENHAPEAAIAPAPPAAAAAPPVVLAVDGRRPAGKR